MPEKRREMGLLRKEVVITRRNSTKEKYSIYVDCRSREHGQEIAETVLENIGWDAFKYSDLSHKRSGVMRTETDYDYEVKDLEQVPVDKFEPQAG